MNDETLDDELDLGTEKAPGSWKKILVIVLGVLLLLGIGGGAAYYFLASGDEKAKGDEQAEATTEEALEKEVEEEEKGPAIYQSLDPLFVARLQSADGKKARMLQIGVEVMTRNQELADFIKHNEPMIRHNLLRLFGARQASELEDRAGKEKLQADVLAELKRITDEQRAPGELEAVYFTSFVIQ